MVNPPEVKAFDAAVRERFPAIQQVWGSLRAPYRVLDYGCGNGVLTYWMYANGFGQDCLGLDISATGIEYAQQYFARAGLQFQILTPLKPLDHYGEFDVVVSSHVLEHIHHPHQALAQMLPLADWFVLEVPLEDCFAQNAIATMRGNTLRQNPLGHVNFWSKQSFAAFVQSMGLMILRDFQYASAPFSPFNSRSKRWLEQALLRGMGVPRYGWLMATHYAVLARRHPAWQERLRWTLSQTGAERHAV
jgi:SAM-dependent methyltransferase